MSESLLAVDLGLRMGLAYFGRDARLIWYRSHNLGSKVRLRKAVHSILGEMGGPSVLVIEGGGDLATVWIAEANRRGIRVHLLGAEIWRNQLLLPREQRTGAVSKQNADVLARKVIRWSGARKPTSLRHDAAEAICIGLWGVLEVQWLEALPAELRS